MGRHRIRRGEELFRYGAQQDAYENEFEVLDFLGLRLQQLSQLFDVYLVLVVEGNPPLELVHSLDACALALNVPVNFIEVLRLSGDNHLQFPIDFHYQLERHPLQLLVLKTLADLLEDILLHDAEKVEQKFLVVLSLVLQAVVAPEVPDAGLVQVDGCAAEYSNFVFDFVVFVVDLVHQLSFVLAGVFRVGQIRLDDDSLLSDVVAIKHLPVLDLIRRVQNRARDLLLSQIQISLLIEEEPLLVIELPQIVRHRLFMLRFQLRKIPLHLVFHLHLVICQNLHCRLNLCTVLTFHKLDDLVVIHGDIPADAVQVSKFVREGADLLRSNLADPLHQSLEDVDRLSVALLAEKRQLKVDLDVIHMLDQADQHRIVVAGLSVQGHQLLIFLHQFLPENYCELANSCVEVRQILLDQALIQRRLAEIQEFRQSAVESSDLLGVVVDGLVQQNRGIHHILQQVIRAG